MNPLIIIAGPTAVGKSDIAVKFAKLINGSIISADSMQVYKGMDIGSAKITVEEMQGIKHYLIDVLEPTEDFNVALFKNMATHAIKDILSEGKIPIIAGGTGFYIQSVLYDIDFNESKGEISAYRNELENLALEKGPDYLFDMLLKVDPESTKTIHKNNVKRVIRALEFYHETGKPISEHNEVQRKKDPAYNSCYFVLNDLRKNVYDRIDLRVDKMINMGLVDEVKGLIEQGMGDSHTSMQGLGYKEIYAYLKGEITLDEAIYIIKRDSRHFAKRQITWFNREPDVIWLNKNEFDYVDQNILNYMLDVCKKKKIVKD